LIPLIVNWLFLFVAWRLVRLR